MSPNKTVLAPRNRIISESTGLYKLQLSPQNRPPPSPTKLSRGLRVSVPIVEQNEVSAPDKNDLLRKYASRQAKLMELEKQAELVRFELLELQAQLEAKFHKSKPDAGIQQDMARLTKRVSTIFQSSKKNKEKEQEDTKKAHSAEIVQNPQHHLETQQSLRIEQHQQEHAKQRSGLTQTPSKVSKKASGLFFQPQLPFNHELKKKASMMLPTQEEMKKKASMMFNTKFMTDVKDKMDQQQAEIDRFTEKSFGIARNFLTSLSPKKSDNNVADSSFMLDNVVENSMLNTSVLLSEDESNGSVLHFEDSIIDIDDYSSSDEA